MSLRKYIIALLACTAAWSQLEAQQLFVRAEPNASKVHLKWLTNKLVNANGYHVEKSINGGAFQQITTTPLAVGRQRTELQSNNEIKRIGALLADSNFDVNTDPIAKLLILTKLIKNNDLADYIGVYFEDKNPGSGALKYRVVTVGDGAVIATSTEFESSNGYLETAPTGIDFKQRNRSISIGWANETTRYYAVNVLRTEEGSSESKLLTPEPIMYSGDAPVGGKKSIYQYIDRTIKRGVEYNYTLQSVDYFGLPANISDAITLASKDVIPPKKPEDPSFDIAHEALEVGIQWKYEGEEDIAGFDLYFSDGDTNDWKIVKSGIAAEERLVSVKVDKIGLYYARLVAYDAAGNRATGKYGFFDVEDRIAPVSPKQFTSQLDSNLVTLNWNQSSSPDVGGYIIYRKKTVGGDFLRMNDGFTDTLAYRENIAKRFVGNIIYRLFSRDTNGNVSKEPLELTVTFSDKNAPGVPTITSATFVDREVTIQWQPSIANDLKGYQLQRQSKSDTSWKKVNRTPLTASATGFTDRAVETAKIYSYRVRGIDSVGNTSDWSNLKTIKTPAQINTVSIKSFQAKYDKRAQKVNLTWEVQNQEQMLAYAVFYKTADASAYKPLSGKLNINNYSTKIEVSNEYTYQLKVYDKKGKKISGVPQTVKVELKTK